MTKDTCAECKKQFDSSNLGKCNLCVEGLNYCDECRIVLKFVICDGLSLGVENAYVPYCRFGNNSVCHSHYVWSDDKSYCDDCTGKSDAVYKQKKEAISVILKITLFGDMGGIARIISNLC